jgi:hypothetical protein
VFELGSHLIQQDRVDARIELKYREFATAQHAVIPSGDYLSSIALFPAIHPQTNF